MGEPSEFFGDVHVEGNITADGQIGDGTGEDPDRHVAANFDGSDADERLDNAIDESSQGDVIFLESATYSEDRELERRRAYIGTGATFQGTTIDAEWHLSDGGGADAISILDGFTTEEGSEIIADERARVMNGYLRPDDNSPITVQGDDVLVIGMYRGEVVFEDGTSGGLIDGCIDTNVTGHGDYTEGTIG